MEHLLDAIGVIGGISWHLLSILALLGIVLGMGKLKEFCRQHEEVMSIIKALGAAQLDEKGKPLLDHNSLSEIKTHLTEIRNQVNDHSLRSLKHFDDTERAASEDKFRNCDVQKCVQIKDIAHEIERVQDRFNQFDQRADESRSSTTVSLNSLRQTIQSIESKLSDLAKTIITVLDNNLRDRSRNNK